MQFVCRGAYNIAALIQEKSSSPTEIIEQVRARAQCLINSTATGHYSCTATGTATGRCSTQLGRGRPIAGNIKSGFHADSEIQPPIRIVLSQHVVAKSQA
jgi:hypothetical protein